MRITILANRDIASNFAINQLLETLGHHQITIFLSAKVGGKTAKPPALQQLKFFEQDLFNELLYPLLERTESSGVNTRYKSFGEISSLLEKPIVELNTINSAEELALFRSSAPDLVLSIRYGVILRESVIAVPKLGVINLHSGLLPDYRGVMATFWALLNGEKTIGTSLHFIDDAQIDTGKIISQATIKVVPERSYLWHVLALYESGCDLITQCVKDLENGIEIETFAQGGDGNYYSFPSSSDLESFFDAGLSLYKESELISFIKKYYF